MIQDAEMIPDFIEKMTKAYGPNEAFLQENSRPLSHAVVYNRVQALVEHLPRLKLERGHKVAIMGKNCANRGIAFLP